MHAWLTLLRLPSGFFLRGKDDDVSEDVMDALDTLLALQPVAAVSLPVMLSLRYDRVSAAASPVAPSYPPMTPGAMLSGRNDDRRRSQNDPGPAAVAPRSPPPPS